MREYILGTKEIEVEPGALVKVATTKSEKRGHLKQILVSPSHAPAFWIHSISIDGKSTFTDQQEPVPAVVFSGVASIQFRDEIQEGQYVEFEVRNSSDKSARFAAAAILKVD